MPHKEGLLDYCPYPSVCYVAPRGRYLPTHIGQIPCGPAAVQVRKVIAKPVTQVLWLDILFTISDFRHKAPGASDYSQSIRFMAAGPCADLDILNPSLR